MHGRMRGGAAKPVTHVATATEPVDPVKYQSFTADQLLAVYHPEGTTRAPPETLLKGIQFFQTEILSKTFSSSISEPDQKVRSYIRENFESLTREMDLKELQKKYNEIANVYKVRFPITTPVKKGKRVASASAGAASAPAAPAAAPRVAGVRVAPAAAAPRVAGVRGTAPKSVHAAPPASTRVPAASAAPPPRAALKEVKTERSTAAAQLVSMEERLAVISIERESLKEELLAAQIRVSTFDTVVASLEGLRIEYDLLKESMVNKEEEYQRNISSKTAEINRLREDREEIARNLTEVMALLDENEQQIIALQNSNANTITLQLELAAQQAILEKERQELAETQKKLNERIRSIDDNEHVNKLNLELDKLRADREADLTSSNYTLEKNNEQHRVAVEKLQQELERNRLALMSSNSDKARIELELGLFRAEKEKVNASYEANKAELDEIRQIRKVQDATVLDLTRERDAAKAGSGEALTALGAQKQQLQELNGRIEQLQGLLAKHTSIDEELASIERAQAHLAQQETRFQAEKAGIAQENEELRKENAELRRSDDELKRQYAAEFTKALAGLQEKYRNNYDDKLLQLEEINRALNNEKSVLHSEMELLRERLKKFTTLLEENSVLKNKIKRLEEEASQIELRRSSSQELATTLDTIQTLDGAFKIEQARLAGEIASLKEQLRQQSATHEQQLISLAREHDLADKGTKRKAALFDELHSTRKDIDSLQQALDDDSASGRQFNLLHRACELLERNKEQLRINELKLHGLKAKAERTQAVEDENAALLRQVELTNQDKDKITKLTAEIATNQAKIAELEKYITEVAAENERLKGTVEQQRVTLENKAEEIRSLKESNAQQVKKIAESEEQLSAINAEIAAAQKALEGTAEGGSALATASIAALIAKAKAIQEESVALQKQLADGTEKLAAITADNERLRAELEAKPIVNAEQQARIDALTAQISAQSAEHATVLAIQQAQLDAASQTDEERKKELAGLTIASNLGAQYRARKIKELAKELQEKSAALLSSEMDRAEAAKQFAKDRVELARTNERIKAELNRAKAEHFRLSDKQQQSIVSLTGILQDITTALTPQPLPDGSDATPDDKQQVIAKVKAQVDQVKALEASLQEEITRNASAMQAQQASLAQQAAEIASLKKNMASTAAENVAAIAEMSRKLADKENENMLLTDAISYKARQNSYLLGIVSLLSEENKKLTIALRSEKDINVRNVIKINELTASLLSQNQEIIKKNADIARLKEKTARLSALEVQHKEKMSELQCAMVTEQKRNAELTAEKAQHEKEINILARLQEQNQLLLSGLEAMQAMYTRSRSDYKTQPIFHQDITKERVDSLLTISEKVEDDLAEGTKKTSVITQQIEANSNLRGFLTGLSVLLWPEAIVDVSANVEPVLEQVISVTEDSRPKEAGKKTVSKAKRPSHVATVATVDNLNLDESSWNAILAKIQSDIVKINGYSTYSSVEAKYSTHVSPNKRVIEFFTINPASQTKIEAIPALKFETITVNGANSTKIGLCNSLPSDAAARDAAIQEIVLATQAVYEVLVNKARAKNSHLPLPVLTIAANGDLAMAKEIISQLKAISGMESASFALDPKDFSAADETGKKELRTLLRAVPPVTPRRSFTVSRRRSSVSSSGSWEGEKPVDGSPLLPLSSKPTRRRLRSGSSSDDDD